MSAPSHTAGAFRLPEEGAGMADAPADLTLADVHRELVASLPEWKRHQRCPQGARCRAEHAEWMDVLLEEFSALSGAAH